MTLHAGMVFTFIDRHCGAEPVERELVLLRRTDSIGPETWLCRVGRQQRCFYADWLTRSAYYTGRREAA